MYSTVCIPLRGQPRIWLKCVWLPHMIHKLLARSGAQQAFLPRSGQNSDLALYHLLHNDKCLQDQEHSKPSFPSQVQVLTWLCTTFHIQQLLSGARLIPDEETELGGKNFQCYSHQHSKDTFDGSAQILAWLCATVCTSSTNCT